MSRALAPDQVHARFATALALVGLEALFDHAGRVRGGPQTTGELVRGIQRGDERARCAVIERLPYAGRPELAHELALAVVSCPQLHAQESLMRTSLRELVEHGGPELESILAALPPELLRRYSTPPPPPLPVARSWSGLDHGSASWLSRYRAGEHEAVWSEVRAAGDRFCDEEELDRARQVALVTMERVRRNLWTLNEALLAIGYPTDREQAWLHREARAAHPLLEKLSRVGPVPLSLAAFFDVVGGVCFVPEDPGCRPVLGLRVEQLDPLLIWPAEIVSRDYDDWVAAATRWVVPEELRLDLSPDSYRKASYSGGAAYSVVLPDGSADPIVHVVDMPLVEYLRLAILQRGGFPGLDLEHPGAASLVAHLTEALEPF